jgi:hypothetical protein
MRCVVARMGRRSVQNMERGEVRVKQARSSCVAPTSTGPLVGGSLGTTEASFVAAAPTYTAAF